MCMQATCPTCQKASWYGCGNHVPSVMDQIPVENRCTCEPKVEKDGKQYPPKAASAVVAGVNSALGWVSGKVFGSPAAEGKDGKGKGEL